MWFPAMFLIIILVSYWQFTLIGLALWIVFRMVWAYVSADPQPKPKSQPKPVRPQPRPKPAPEPPAPTYVSRWSTTRRFWANREADEWEREYDRTDELARRAGGLHRSSTAAPVSGG